MGRYVVILLCFVTFITLSTFPGWHEEIDENGSEREVKPFPSRPVSHFSLMTSVIGVGFGLISVLWQHINSSSTATMVEVLTYGAVSGHVGGAAMALGWISVGTAALVCVAIYVMIMSIRILRHIDDEDTSNGYQSHYGEGSSEGHS